jgi:cytochrome P450
MTHVVGTDRLGPLPAIVAPGGAGPVARVSAPTGDQVWLVSDYRLGRLVLSDPRFSRAAATRPGAPRVNSVNPASTSMMSMDGAGHARLRRLVAGAFAPRRVAALAAQIRRLVDDLLDEVCSADRPVDLVAAFTVPLPCTVISVLLGIPADDRAVIRDWAGVLFDVSAGTDRDKMRRAFALVGYMSKLVDRRRAEPGDDLMSTLIAAHDVGRLSRAELVDLAVAVITAGYETTAGQLGLTILSLLLDPAPRRELRHPATAAAVLEEYLRLAPATPTTFPRVALEDVDLGGVTVRAGQAVVVSLLHGNRDGVVFTDPHRLSSTRRSAAHLTFGHGAHYCLGAELARLQLNIAVPALLRRLPDLRLAAGADAVGWNEGMATRGPARLRVTW